MARGSEESAPFSQVFGLPAQVNPRTAAKAPTMGVSTAYIPAGPAG